MTDQKTYSQKMNFLNSLIAVAAIYILSLPLSYAQTEPLISCSPSPCIATLEANTGAGGIFFNLTAESNDIFITQIDFFEINSPAGQREFQIYSRPDSYVGYAETSNGWSAGTIQSLVGGTFASGDPYTYQMNDFLIPAGETFGFFLGVDNTNSRENFDYRDEGIFITDGRITLFSALAKGKTGTTVLDKLETDVVFSPRSFSGIIRYRLDDEDDSSCYIVVTENSGPVTYCL